MKKIQVNVSVSTFVPKAFTPFQWVAMDSKEVIEEKQKYLKEHLTDRGLSFSWNNPDLSLLEGVFSRGDRRLAPVIESAWRKGARFDGWGELFAIDKWEAAFRENQLDMSSYLRARELDELLPWDHIDVGVNKKFLRKEYKAAHAGELTRDCRQVGCTGCAICFDLDVKMELYRGDVNVN